MRAVLLAGLVIASLAPLAAQPRTQAPTFEPGDTEGLVASPNPRVRHAWKRKVFWKVSQQSPRGASRSIPAHTAAERSQMSAALDALSAILKATPTGSDGEGFWMLDSRTFDYPDPSALPATMPLAKFPLVFEAGLFPFRHEDIEKDGKWQLSVRGETESVYFQFNRLPDAVDATPILSESQAGDREPVPFYLRPRVTATWQGLPVYEGKVLVVAREGRDPWAPVPLRRALEAAMGPLEKDRKGAEERLAGYRKAFEEVMAPAWEQQKREAFEQQNGELRTSRPSNYAARLRSLEHEITVTRQGAEENANPQKDAKGAWYWGPVNAHDDAAGRLAALSPAAAAAPACFVELSAAERASGRYALPGTIVPESAAPGCRQIVHTNWAYFDLSLPRSAPQILVVRDFGRCATVENDGLTSAPITRWDSPPQGCVQHARIWREADWTKIAALLRFDANQLHVEHQHASRRAGPAAVGQALGNP